MLVRVFPRLQPVYDDIVATPVEGGYALSGRKLWATNGMIADITVVMAKVPESEGHRRGISAFVMPYHSEGVRAVPRRSSTSCGPIVTTPITPPPRRCWPVATRGWRTGSLTRPATTR